MHGFRNASDAEVRYLNLHAPGRQFASFMRVTRLADVAQIAMWEVLRGPDSATAWHVHRDHAQSLYVLEGELALTTGDGTRRAPAGSWVQIPDGAAHALAPAGAEPVRYLEIRVPTRTPRPATP